VSFHQTCPIMYHVLWPIGFGGASVHGFKDAAIRFLPWLGRSTGWMTCRFTARISQVVHGRRLLTEIRLVSCLGLTCDLSFYSAFCAVQFLEHQSLSCSSTANAFTQVPESLSGFIAAKKATQALDFALLIDRYHFSRTWHRSPHNGFGISCSRLFAAATMFTPLFFSVVLQGALTILLRQLRLTSSGGINE